MATELWSLRCNSWRQPRYSTQDAIGVGHWLRQSCFGTFLSSTDIKGLIENQQHEDLCKKIKEHLKVEFQQHDPVRTLLKGESESVKEYTRRMQAISVALERYKCPVNTMDELTTFAQGLRPDIQYHLEKRSSCCWSLRGSTKAIRGKKIAQQVT